MTESEERLIKELKKLSELLASKTSEVFVVRDENSGRMLELQSNTFNAEQLANLGLGCWNNFFQNSKTKNPHYIT